MTFLKLVFWTYLLKIFCSYKTYLSFCCCMMYLVSLIFFWSWGIRSSSLIYRMFFTKKVSIIFRHTRWSFSNFARSRS